MSESSNNVFIFDEVHEWNNNIETLVALSKKFIKEGMKNKIILMSATLETQKIKEYFGEDATVFEIPGRRYKVEKRHLENVKISEVVRHFVEKKKNMLVFFPGKKEIQDLIDELYSEVDAVVLPLHGELSIEEQNKCFEIYEKPKVVVATNIAQTSITIDVDVVIDSGKERCTKVENGVESLVLSDISKADIEQRAGRAGRLKEGEYILCSENGVFERPDFPKPEIERSILDQVVLRLADISIDASELEFFHEPDMKEIINAKESLKCIGALNEEGSITEIGCKMSKIPLSCKYARMVVEAEKRGVTSDVIVIAAIMEIGGLIDKKSTYHRHTNESISDLLAELEIWNKFTKTKFVDFDKERVNKKNFWRVKELVKKMFESLKDLNLSSTHDKNDIMYCCLCGMLENVFVRNYDMYHNGNGKMYSIDKQSCVSNVFNLVTAIPKTIQFKNRYERDVTANFITMVTAIEYQMLLEIAPHLFTFDDEDLRFSENYMSVIITKNIYYRGIRIFSEYVKVPDHPEAKRLKEEWEEEQKSRQLFNGFNIYNPRQEHILVDGYSFRVRYDYRGKDPTVYLTKEELLNLLTLKSKTLKLENGKDVKISCNGCNSSNVISLLQILENQKISYCLNEFKNSLPSESSVKKSVVTQWFNLVGKVEITSKDIPNEEGKFEKIYRYVHLEVVDKKVKVNLSEDEVFANENTKEALMFLFGKEIKQNCNEKKFLVQKDNKKVLNKKGEEAKKTFEEFFYEAVECLSIKNFEELIEYICSIFEELTQDFCKA